MTHLVYNTREDYNHILSGEIFEQLVLYKKKLVLLHGVNPTESPGHPPRARNPIAHSP